MWRARIEFTFHVTTRTTTAWPLGRNLDNLRSPSVLTIERMTDGDALNDALDAVIAETSFSGVVRVHLSDGHRRARSRTRRPCPRHRDDDRHAHRHRQRCEGIHRADGDGARRTRGLPLTTTARELLGDDLPLIDEGVTVEHLLAHRSGIGDYLDESELDDVTSYVMPIPVHRLATPEDYLVVLGGHPQVSPPGERFNYNNAGFVVLAVLAERAAGTPYHRLIDELVVGPAGLTHTAFLRGDELPGDVAIGYLAADGLRTNVLHLPVRGVGDGGVSTTAADLHRLWTALDAGQIVSPDAVARMTRPHSVETGTSAGYRYGLGYWLPAAGGSIEMEGHDAGASFRSTHRASAGLTVSVLSNTSEGTWPVARRLAELVAT